MWEKIKLYFRYVVYCWKARPNLEDNKMFLGLSEERPKLRVEIRNLTGKVKMQRRKDTLSKAHFLRLMFYEALTQSEEETFQEEMLYVSSLMSLWAITKEE